MKSEFYNHPTKGLCILISAITLDDFQSLGCVDISDISPFSTFRLFTDIQAIAKEISKGRYVAAIKEVRSQTGWGLKEAKEYIEKYPCNSGTSMARCRDSARKFIKDHKMEDFIEKDDFEL